MNDDEAGLWVAWWHGHRDRLKNEQPGFGAILDGTLYHGGGPTRFTFKPGSLLVLKEYGTYTNEGADEAGLFEQFDRDFPAVPGTLDELIELGSGWVAPDGTVYPCDYGKHQTVARLLAIQNGLVEPDDSYWLSTKDDTLVTNRWLRISPAVFSWDWNAAPSLSITKRQIAVLKKFRKKLKAAPAETKNVKALLAECERALDWIK